MSVTQKQDTVSSARNNKKVSFCSYCGSELDNGARFCKICGKAVAGNLEKDVESKYEKPYKENFSERKNVYEGHVHKCPSCGEILESFLTICPSCGYEIRDAKSSASVQELALKLETISAQEFPTVKGKKSVMKMVFGKDFKDEDAEKSARNEFEDGKAQQKANVIMNFPVPNTKEDILEFMILASSNIDIHADESDIITKSWLSKAEQVYNKALILMSHDSDFEKVKEIYDNKIKEWQRTQSAIKQKKRLTIALGIIVAVIGILMIIIGFIIGSMSGDENSPFYMIGMLGMIIAIIDGLIFLIQHSNAQGK